MFILAPHHRKVSADVGIPTNGLLCHWKIDENGGNTLFDDSGNGHHLSLTGGTWGLHNGEVFLEFNGAGDHALGTDDCGVGGLNNATLLYRAQLKDTIGTEFIIGIQRPSGTRYIASSAVYAQAGGRAMTHFKLDTLERSGWNRYNDSPLDPNWIYVAALFHETGRPTYYLEGVLQTPNSGTGSPDGPILTGGKMSIARDEGDFGRDGFFNLKWAIWYNRILSEQEIIDIGNIKG